MPTFGDIINELIEKHVDKEPWRKPLERFMELLADTIWNRTNITVRTDWVVFQQTVERIIDTEFIQTDKITEIQTHLDFNQCILHLNIRLNAKYWKCPGGVIFQKIKIPLLRTPQPL